MRLRLLKLKLQFYEALAGFGIWLESRTPSVAEHYHLILEFLF